MTKDQLKKLLKNEDLEYVLHAVQELIQADLENYKKKSDVHPEVIACLEGAIENCRHAAFCWYASFK